MAAFRIHDALLEAGHSSRMIVRQKESERPEITEVPAYLNPWQARGRRIARKLPLLPREELPDPPPPAFNLDVEQDIRRDLFYSADPDEVDVVVLHFVTRLLTVRETRQIVDHYKAPVLWRLADQAPVTGGCHYSYDCDGYTDRCGLCPQLGSEREDDRSRTVWKRKHELLRPVPITFVGPSTPACDWVRESSVFAEHRVELIPDIVDVDVFRPLDPAIARDVLQLPARARIVVLGAGAMLHARKGLVEYAPAALEQLKSRLQSDPDGLQMDRDLFVVAVGGGGDELLERLPYPGRALGMLGDDVTIALALQAGDVFLCPTLADAGPLMIPEALACGTPVVSFDVGYAVDLVRTGETGHLVRTRDAADLARGLEEILRRDRASWVHACRSSVLQHAPAAVAQAYAALAREPSVAHG
jgi:glycosyltransferase involved in cell wall biosynthesis